MEIIETKKKVEPQSQAREIELVPPKTAYQFEMDWRQVRGNAQLFYKYLKVRKNQSSQQRCLIIDLLVEDQG